MVIEPAPPTKGPEGVAPELPSHLAPVVGLYPAVEEQPAGRPATAVSHFTPVVELYPAVEEQPAGRPLATTPARDAPVIGPTTPSAVRPLAVWYAITAALVIGPKLPSATR